MLSLEVRDMIARYVSSEINLEELENWVIRHLPALAADPQSDDTAMTAAVELCLAEYSDGIRSEAEIRRYLREALLENITVIVSFAEIDNCNPGVRSSASATRNERLAVRGSAVTHFEPIIIRS